MPKIESIKTGEKNIKHIGKFLIFFHILYLLYFTYYIIMYLIFYIFFIYILNIPYILHLKINKNTTVSKLKQ